MRACVRAREGVVGSHDLNLASGVPTRGGVDKQPSRNLLKPLVSNFSSPQTIRTSNPQTLKLLPSQLPTQPPKLPTQPLNAIHGQLDREIRAGGWYVFQGTANSSIVFDWPHKVNEALGFRLEDLGRSG